MITPKNALAGLAAVLAPIASAASSFVLVENMGSYSFDGFNSNQPGAPVSSAAVTGLSAGEVLNGLDYRPATRTFYAIGQSNNVYVIDPGTGIASSIGTHSQTVPGSLFGFDFNPSFTSGRFARIISDQNDNRVIDGVDGSYLGSIEKIDVFYPAGDANAGLNPEISHIAYTNSVPGATSTQQYGIDTNLNVLTTVANNAGTLGTVGSLGINAGTLGGFDINGLTGEAILGFQNGDGTSGIFSVDLVTGAATSLGSFQGNIIGLTTSIPEPSRALLLSFAGLSLVMRRRR